MSEPVILYHTDESVGIVTMNRPDKLNALNHQLKTELMDAFRKADQDPATSVVILRAAGRSFCVGYDIDRNPDKDTWIHDALRWHTHLNNSVELEMAPWTMRKPVIAEVQGHCLGGGCELAMVCDLTVAADDALFGEPEVRFSNVGPGMVMPWFIGLKKARELLFLGDTIDAETALDLGMVNRVVPRAKLEAETLKYARRLTLISPEALRVAKLAINRGADAAGFRNAINVGLDVVAPLYAAKTADGLKFKEITDRDGLGAALKWRRDQFKG